MQWLWGWTDDCWLTLKTFSQVKHSCGSSLLSYIGPAPVLNGIWTCVITVDNLSHGPHLLNLNIQKERFNNLPGCALLLSTVDVAAAAGLDVLDECYFCSLLFYVDHYCVLSTLDSPFWCTVVQLSVPTTGIIYFNIIPIPVWHHLTLSWKSF